MSNKANIFRHLSPFFPLYSNSKGQSYELRGKNTVRQMDIFKKKRWVYHIKGFKQMFYNADLLPPITGYV